MGNTVNVFIFMGIHFRGLTKNYAVIGSYFRGSAILILHTCVILSFWCFNVRRQADQRKQRKLELHGKKTFTVYEISHSSIIYFKLGDFIVVYICHGYGKATSTFGIQWRPHAPPKTSRSRSIREGLASKKNLEVMPNKWPPVRQWTLRYLCLLCRNVRFIHANH